MKKNKKQTISDYDLEKYIGEYNLLEYLIKDGNEVDYSTGDITYFKNCKVCGHKDCYLIYYHKHPLFCCTGIKDGGDIISYLQITKNLSERKAIEYFINNLLKLDTPLEKFIESHRKELNFIDDRFIADRKKVSESVMKRFEISAEIMKIRRSFYEKTAEWEKLMD